MIYRHSLSLRHRRDPMSAEISQPSAESAVEIDSYSDSLTEAWREALSRMPNDLYGALKEAMKDIR